MKESENLRLRLSLGSLVFGILTALCLYKTSGGISFAFYCAGALVFFVCYLFWTGRRMKPESIFLSAILLVLAVCSAMTIDSGLRFFNFCTICLLADRILVHQFSEDGHWSVSQHLGQLLKTIFRILENLPAWFTDCLFKNKTPNAGGKNGGAQAASKAQGENVKGNIASVANIMQEAPDAADASSDARTTQTADDAMNAQTAQAADDASDARTAQATDDTMNAQTTQADAAKKARKGDTLSYVILGLCISLPLLVVVLIALASADRVFADVLSRLISLRLLRTFFQNLVPILLYVLFGGMLSCAALTCFSKRKEKPLPKHVPDKNPVVAITILSVLGAVYVLFCAIQIIFLFGKASLPDGYTYASYARRGFFQLLFVCILNVLLILLTTEVFQKNRALRILSVGFSICTLIMNVSATYRVLLYIQAYDMTYPRLIALTGLGVVYFLLAGLLVWIFRSGFPFFRYMLIVLSLTLVFLNLLHPARFVASYNLEHSEELDWEYLIGLGPEALPAVAEAYEDGELFTGKFNDYLEKMTDRWRYGSFYEKTEEELGDFRSYNAARQRIKEILEKYNYYVP